jgi:hypothetical protein
MTVSLFGHGVRDNRCGIGEHREHLKRLCDALQRLYDAWHIATVELVTHVGLKKLRHISLFLLCPPEHGRQHLRVLPPVAQDFFGTVFIKSTIKPASSNLPSRPNA